MCQLKFSQNQQIYLVDGPFLKTQIDPILTQLKRDTLRNVNSSKMLENDKKIYFFLKNWP